MKRHSQSAAGTPPALLGFRHHAEWEKHDATWLGWPHNLTDWPGKFAPIPWVYGEITRILTRGETVRIIVQSSRHESSARRILDAVGADLSRIEFFRFPTNRGWTRDFGPIFATRTYPRREAAVLDFKFNAWAKYPDWKKDVRIHQRVAKALHLAVVTPMLHGSRVVLEGGAIDLNGSGSILTTEECLLDPDTQVRNPGLSRADMEAVFHDYLGARHTIWLGRGIAGDDTHGHVDDLCRFVNRTTVVLCQEENPSDANYVPLQENRERLKGARLEDGSSLNVIPLPMPAPLIFRGQRLPASYANFYVSNSAVIVPTFNDPADRRALGILSELFTDREVVGIHAVDLVWGLGTLHCLTHEQPTVG